MNVNIGKKKLSKTLKAGGLRRDSGGPFNDHQNIKKPRYFKKKKEKYIFCTLVFKNTIQNYLEH